MKFTWVSFLLLLSSKTAFAIPSSINEHINHGNYSVALEELNKLVPSDYNDKVRIEATIGSVLRRLSRFEEALEILEPLSKRPNIELTQAFEIANETGIAARNLAKFIVAQEAYETALKIAIDLDDKAMIAKSYINLGVLNEQANDFNRALGYYEKAQQFLHNSTDWNIKASLEYNLGAVSERMADLEQATFYYRRALDYDKKSGNKNNIATTGLKLATLLGKHGDPIEALLALEQTIDELTQLGDHSQLSRAYYAKASVYEKLNESDLRHKAALKSLEHGLLTQSKIQQSHGYLAVIKSELNRKNVDIAKQYLPIYEELTANAAFSFFKISILEMKAAIAELEGDHQLANTYLRKINELNTQSLEEKLKIQAQKHKSSLDLVAEKQQVSVLEQDKKLTISQLENAKLLQQRWLLAFALTFMCVVTFIYLYIHKKRSADLKAQLFETSLKQKDQMLADISHELRTPLSVLKLHIEAMEYNLIDDESLAYEKINDKINQLNHLISDVYQLSQAENNSLTVYPESYNVHQLMTSYSYDMQRMVAKHGLRFICDISIEKELSLLIDKPKLDRIINNLTKNACLYTDTPGLVRLKVRTNPKYLFIQIDDSSPGVDKEQLNRLFERLYRVDSSRNRASGGSGLGLSICQSLVQVMQGKIDLKQGKYGGLCVRLLLPYDCTAK